MYEMIILSEEVSIMVRTTITLAEEEFADLKRLAAQRDRSISWLLRQAFRLSKRTLERGGPYAMEFDRVWQEVGRSLHRAGVRTARDVNNRVAEFRATKRRSKAKAVTR